MKKRTRHSSQSHLDHPLSFRCAPPEAHLLPVVSSCSKKEQQEAELLKVTGGVLKSALPSPQEAPTRSSPPQCKAALHVARPGGSTPPRRGRKPPACPEPRGRTSRAPSGHSSPCDVLRRGRLMNGGQTPGSPSWGLFHQTPPSPSRRFGSEV